MSGPPWKITSSMGFYTNMHLDPPPPPLEKVGAPWKIAPPPEKCWTLSERERERQNLPMDGWTYRQTDRQTGR